MPVPRYTWDGKHPWHVMHRAQFLLKVRVSVAVKIGNAGVALVANLATHGSYSLSKRRDNLHVWRLLW